MNNSLRKIEKTKQKQDAKAIARYDSSGQIGHVVSHFLGLRAPAPVDSLD